MWSIMISFLILKHFSNFIFFFLTFSKKKSECRLFFPRIFHSGIWTTSKVIFSKNMAPAWSTIVSGVLFNSYWCESASSSLRTEMWTFELHNHRQVGFEIVLHSCSMWCTLSGGSFSHHILTIPPLVLSSCTCSQKSSLWQNVKIVLLRVRLQHF